jgi:hypothetical protein
MSKHKIVFVTKEAKRIAVIDLTFTKTTSWVNECKNVATKWLEDNNMTLASYFPANGTLTVWVE